MTEEIRKQIEKIKIKTKRLMQSTLVGDYLSAFKGSGLEFDQLREYSIGDDIRFIDWNSSAKMNKIMVKQFIEERDRTIILAIDVSKSSAYGSRDGQRAETIAQVASTLAYIATKNKDRVGALFFSDRVEKWIKPKRGRVNFSEIVEAIFSIEPEGEKTEISQALRFLLSLKQRNAVLFVLSDWIEDARRYEKLLNIARLKFDLVSVRFLDRQESKLASFGLLEISDPETGERCTIDTRSKKINTFLTARQLEQENLFKKKKIDILDLKTGEPFANKMVQFFHQRIRRQI